MTVVTFLTDYGAGSEHLGALHAILASACPEVARIDLAHDIHPGDVRGGSLVLARLVPLSPPGVHVAVVDPGVGTSRRGIAVELTGGRLLVGPDNGLLAATWRTLGARRAVELSSPVARREEVSPTFHGRDVFAPSAAHLAAGGALAALGPELPVSDLVVLDAAWWATGSGRIAGEAVGVDRFGNVQLAAPASAFGETMLSAGTRVTVEVPGGRVGGRVGAVFADVPPGELVVFADSHGHVAIAVNGGRADQALGVGVGTRVTIARL